jgi:hypothetical protein
MAVIRGRHKLELIQKLASGDVSRSDLAKEYDVTPGSITSFAKRNAEAIQAVLAGVEDEMNGLWIAKQHKRIAEYEALAEHLDTIIYSESTWDANKLNAVLRKTQVLRNAAEELGQLTLKTEASGKYNYTVEGVDMSKLGG